MPSRICNCLQSRHKPMHFNIVRVAETLREGYPGQVLVCEKGQQILQSSQVSAVIQTVAQLGYLYV